MKTEVLFFHAYWCKSCPKMQESFNAVAKEFKQSEVEFTDVDAESDWGVDMSCKYQVRNVPTVLIVKKGRVIERVSGTRTKKELKEIIEKWK